MVLKSFLATIALLAVWTWVTTQLPEQLQTEQHQWISNLILAEEYLYNSDVSNCNVLVGSSLSYRLKDDLPENTLNLSFGGQGVFDGLNVIQKSAIKPARVLIEMNVILRPENKSFSQYVFSPITHRFKKLLPGLQVKNQPAGVLKGFLVGRKKLANRKLDESGKGSPKINKNYFKLRADEYSQKPDPKLLEAAFEQLEIVVRELQQDKVSVVFFEMPIHHELNSLTYPQSMRIRFKERFPPNQFTYIEQPDCFQFETTDGLHLNDSDIQKYASFFRDKLESILFADSRRKR